MTASEFLYPYNNCASLPYGAVNTVEFPIIHSSILYNLGCMASVVLILICEVKCGITIDQL